MRRSNSRKSFNQHDNSHLHSSLATTPTPSSCTATPNNTLLINSIVKSTPAQDNCLSHSEHSAASIASSLLHTTAVTSLEVKRSQTIGNNNNNSSTTTTAQTVKMLPTSPNSGNNTMEQSANTDNKGEDSTSSIATPACDLNTDNLPAVDTPDACDKAALR